MSLAAKTVGGALWSIASSIGGRVVGVIGTMLLTHYLAPDVLGEVGVASVLVLSANQLSSLGLGQFVTVRPDAERATVFHATVIHVTLGLLAFLAVLAATWPLEPLFELQVRFESPHLGEYIPGLGLAMVMDRIAYIPERVLMRELRYRNVALTRSASELVYAAVALGCAIHGMGGASVVVANIAQSGFRLVAFVVSAPRREWLQPSRLSWARARELLSFGVPVAVGGVASFASRKWDNLLFAAYFGSGTMAAYNMAYNLADIPATNVAEQVGDVLAPSFARMRPEQRGQALIRSIGLMSLLVFPMAIGLAAISPSLVEALFNEQWQGIAPLLTILAVLSIARPVSYIVTSYLFAQNRPRAVMMLEVGKTAVLLACVAIFATGGLTWACVGVGIAFSLAAAASVWIVYREDRVPLVPLARAIFGPLVACGPLALAAIGVRYLLQSGGAHRPVLELGASIAAGALAYVPAAFVLARGPVSDAVREIRRVFRGRARSQVTATP